MIHSVIKFLGLSALASLLGSCAYFNSSTSSHNASLPGVPAPEWTKYSAKCWGAQQHKGYTTVCKPENRPEECPIEDWKSIQADNGMLPKSCKSNPEVTTPQYLNYLPCFSYSDHDGYKSVCRPKNKPKQCSESDWKIVTQAKDFPSVCD